MKRLVKKNPAIAFIATDYLGNTIDLNNFKGQRVLLSFFRGASCPFCNMRIHELIKHYSEFEENGIVIIALFAAKKEEIVHHAGKQNAPFPIIADPNLNIYKKYGIEESSSGLIRTMAKPIKMIQMMFSGFFTTKSLKDKPLMPADFLIDGNQKIQRAYYGNDFGDHLPISEILEVKW